MKRTFISIVVSAGILLVGFASQAQAPGGPGMRSDMNAALMKLFGDTTAFSADAEMKVNQSAGNAINLTAATAVLDGKMRSELDMSTMKGGQLPPQALTQMKAMGMDKMVTIFDMKSEKLVMLYPNIKSYAEMPVPKSADGAEKKEPKIEKKELGKETVDGHPTVKNKVTITSDGKPHEMTVWNATDMKDFPVKLTMTESGNTVELLYKNIKLAKPDAKLFEAPSDFKKYDTFQQLMMENMQKMTGGAGGVPPGALPKKQQ